MMLIDYKLVNNFAVEDQANKPGCNWRLLLSAIVISILIHAGIGYLFSIITKDLAFQRKGQLQYMPLNVALVPQHSPGGKNLQGSIRNNNGNAVGAGSTGTRINTEQLISEILEFARSQKSYEEQQEEYPFMDTMGNASLGSIEIKTDGLKPGEVESYRLHNGNIKIRMPSLFGGIQCFEVREADFMDEFDLGAWMFSRC